MKLFYVKILGVDDVAEQRYAFDHEDAACKAVEEYDPPDMEIAEGGQLNVSVTNDKGETKTFSVTGEFEPVYYAVEKEDEPEEF